MKASLNYVGNTYQIGGTRHYRLVGGISDNCRCIDVRTGSGLEYTVVCDRGLDISLASYKGKNLSFLTENMEAHPSFYDSTGSNWLNTFTGGLLTTCGPTNISSPCEDDGENLGLHGKWSALSAKKVCDLTDLESGKIEILGNLYDSAPFGHKLKITRRITSQIGCSKIIIEDTIKNEGGKKTPLNLLYHINFGYPFLNEEATVNVSSENCQGYDDYSEERITEWRSIKVPSAQNSEINYLHTFSKEKSEATAFVQNKDLAVYIKFSSQKLPYLTQWKLENIKDYVLALEPANVPCEPRNVLRDRGLLPFLNPGESMDFKVEIGVINGTKNIETFEKTGKVL